MDRLLPFWCCCCCFCATMSLAAVTGSSGASPCGALWPAPTCGHHGQCDLAASACACDEGWGLSPLAVDSVVLCNSPDGLLPAAYLFFTANVSLLALLQGARLVAERAGRRGFGCHTCLDDQVLGLCFLLLTAGAAAVSTAHGSVFQADPAGSLLMFLGSLVLALRQHQTNIRLANAAQGEISFVLRAKTATEATHRSSIALVGVAAIGLASHLFFLMGEISASTNFRVFTLCQLSLTGLSMYKLRR